jgi:hypothetical protein
MRSILSLILLLGISVHCLGQNKDTFHSPIDTITTNTNLDSYLSKLITIKGEVSNTKIPQILGIDVSCEEDCSNGEIGIATGILVKIVVSKQDINRYTQNRGAGIFYKLMEPNSEYHAKASIVKTKTSTK